MKHETKMSILYAIAWAGGIVAGSLLKGWWWLIPAVVTAVVFGVAEELIRER